MNAIDEQITHLTLLPPSRPFPPPLVLRLGGDARLLDGVDELLQPVLERLRLVEGLLRRRLALQTKARVLRGLVRADALLRVRLVPYPIVRVVFKAGTQDAFARLSVY